MKKSLLIVAVFGFTLVSCKKDRVCSCKLNITYTGTHTIDPKLKPADVVADSEYTIVKAGLVTARRKCIHTRNEYPEVFGVKTTVDNNCELK